MREILFRGKRVDGGGWAWGCLVFDSQGRPMIRFFENQEFIRQVLVYPGSLGQFTGLTDKKGKKIFEGDIIESKNLKAHKVEFYNSSFMFWEMSYEDFELCYESDQIEIIGNIHEQ